VDTVQQVAIRHVRASELARRCEWCDFDLKYHSDGIGIWEYRIKVFGDERQAVNNLKPFLDALGWRQPTDDDRLDSQATGTTLPIKIYFDTIEVLKVNDDWKVSV